MKVLGICGSPRSGSNSTFLVREVLRGAKDQGAGVDEVVLGEVDIKLCDGCLSCDKTGKCHFDDEMTGIETKLSWADILVIGTPVRFDNVSPQLKNCFDRTNPLAATEKLKGKKAVLVAVGYWHQDKSRKRALASMRYFCEAHGIKVLGSMGFFEKSGKPGSVLKSDDSAKKGYAAGKRISRDLRFEVGVTE